MIVLRCVLPSIFMVLCYAIVVQRKHRNPDIMYSYLVL